MRMAKMGTMAIVLVVAAVEPAGISTFKRKPRLLEQIACNRSEEMEALPVVLPEAVAKAA